MLCRTNHGACRNFNKTPAAVFFRRDIIPRLFDKRRYCKTAFNFYLIRLVYRNKSLECVFKCIRNNVIIAHDVVQRCGPSTHHQWPVKKSLGSLRIRYRTSTIRCTATPLWTTLRDCPGRLEWGCSGDLSVRLFYP